MRGIKKLVLALFFMTLFGVGFRVEAKAALSTTIDLAIEVPDNDWSKLEPTSTALSGKITALGDEFPDAGNRLFVLTLSNSATPSKEYSDELYVDYVTDGSAPNLTYQIGIGASADGIEYYPNPAASTKNDAINAAKEHLFAIGASKKDVSDDIDATSNKALTYTLKLSEFPSGDSATDTLSVSKYKVTAVAYNQDAPKTPLKSVTIENNEKYYFPGELLDIVLKTPATGFDYEYVEWTYENGTTITDSGATSSGLAINLPPTTSKDETYKVWYKETTSTTYNVEITDDGHGSGTPDPKKGETGDTIEISAYADDDYEFSYWEAISGIDDDDIKNLYSETTTFKIKNDNVKIKAHFSKKSSTKVNPIQVTLGQTVPLSRFLTGSKTISVYGESSIGYLSPSKFSGSADKVNLTGEIVTTTSSGVKDLELNGEDITVHVYRLPEIYFLSSSWGTSLSSSNSSSSSGSNTAFKVVMPPKVFYGENIGYDVEYAGVLLSGSRGNQFGTLKLSSDSSEGVPSKSATADLMSITSILKNICRGSRDILAIEVRPINPSSNSQWETNADISDVDAINVYRIELDGSEGATYTVNDKDVGDYFYAIEGMDYKITAKNKSGYSSTVEKWEGVSFGTSTSGTASFRDARTVKAFFKSNSTTSSSSSSSSARSSSSSSSSKTTAPGGGTGGDYDDVPKTGESKTDIWILWSVLFISILGAGFMIYKRFGLVKAIARAEEEAAIVERQERVEAEKKEKKEKMDLLKSLRDL